MYTEKQVFLMVGQRGAGKTHYGEKLVNRHPTLQAINRDEILTRVFGSTHLSPYTGGHHHVAQIVTRLLRMKFSKNESFKILFDYWTGCSEERKFWLAELRRMGATKVTALYFVTPLEKVEEWFWKKPGIAKASDMIKLQSKGFMFFSKHAPKHDYELFHALASEIDRDGFDEVIRIDPTQELVSLF